MSDAGIERQRAALAIFDQVVDLDPDERRRRLAGLCAGDDELRARVEALLAADASGAEPFAGGVAQWADAIGGDAGTVADTGRPGERVGAWRIIGLLGRGGMGAVYEVERADGAYAQRAALKRVHGGEISASGRERFLRERQVLARLQHPHIAALIDGGFTADGDPYFVMERVDGAPIDRWCDERRLGLRARVGLFLQVLDAVQYAHRNLVVHRDLKPSNLLVTPEGQVKLLDFGIARELEQAGLAATATGDRAMTLQYASPEQLNNQPITTATDLYQLGVVLYRLLSGRHPFGIGADTPLAQQVQALSRDPEPIARGVRQSSAEAAALCGETPASLARMLDGSLGAIVHACLRRDPEARYVSAEALAADLRAWLDDRPVAAAKLDARQRARLWLRRHRAFAASAAAIAIALLAGAGIALWQAHEAREQARLAQSESANARAALGFLTDTLAMANPAQALGTEIGVRELLDRARARLSQPDAASPQLRQPVQRTLGRLYASLGDNVQAVELLDAGLQGAQPRERDEAIALADDLVAYSDALDGLEKTAPAFAAAERAAALRRRFAPGDRQQELRTLAHLTLGHVEKYGWDASRQQAEKALALAKTLPDPPVDIVLDVYSDLGVIAIFQSDRQRMMAVAREGLAFADAHRVPADSPLRLMLRRNLVNGLLMDERYVEAERAAREAIASLQRTGGTGSTGARALVMDLGDALLGQGRYREALALLEANRDVVHGNDGPRNIASHLGSMAVVELAFGDYPAALDLSTQAMDTLARDQVSADDLIWRSLERMHAMAFAANGEYTKAEELLRDLRERARRLDGEDSVEVARTTQRLASVAERLGRTERGLQLLAEARERLSRLNAPALASQLTKLLRIEAALERQRGDLPAAIARQREAVHRSAQIECPPDLAIARAELAGYLSEQGKQGEARSLLAQALPVMREALLPQEENRARAEALARQLGV
ncbi:MAG: serine/threonine-protein kinase [Pseudoxanthomonas sp.]